MFHLSENQVMSIELLSQYKYLTSSQFVKMGLYKRRGYLTNALKVLLDKKKPLIAKHDFNPINGKLESFYYLTKYGKNFLINELEYTELSIKIPVGMKPIYLKDYFHRKYTIDFHIYFNQWIETHNADVDFFNYYFDKSGNNRSDDKTKHVSALNRIESNSTHSFIPDVNMMFTIDSKSYLYLFEQHNGNDTKRLFEQLYIHIIAISEGVVSEKYSFENNHRVVVVCEYKSVMESVIKRLQKEVNIEYYNTSFLFKTNAELEEDFDNNWTLIDGSKVNFLVKPTNENQISHP